MASSNTVFSPRWVRAEHSRYLTEPGDSKGGKAGAVRGRGGAPQNAPPPWCPQAGRSPLTNLPGHGQALGVRDGRQLLVSQPLDGVLVVTEVQLGAHQEDGRVGAVVPHLRVPLWGQRF